MPQIIKYRCLNDQELRELEKEFTHFLIVQGIDDQKWKEINKTEKEKAINLVEIFSNTVFDKIYSKIKYLEYRSSDFFSIFKVLNDETLVLRVSQQKKGLYDFKNDFDLKSCLEKRKSISFEKGKRKHKKDKLIEIHQLITQGCIISNENMWEVFKQFY